MTRTSIPTCRAPYTYWSRSLFWTCDRGSTLLTTWADIGAGERRSAARCVCSLQRQQNIFSIGASIALVVRRTSSITRRLNHINLYRFWARRPSNDDNRRLCVCLGDSEVLTECNRKFFIQSGRLRTQASLPLTHPIHKVIHLFVGPKADVIRKG